MHTGGGLFQKAGCPWAPVISLNVVLNSDSLKWLKPYFVPLTSQDENGLNGRAARTMLWLTGFASYLACIKNTVVRHILRQTMTYDHMPQCSLFIGHNDLSTTFLMNNTQLLNYFVDEK